VYRNESSTPSKASLPGTRPFFQFHFLCENRSPRYFTFNANANYQRQRQGVQLLEHKMLCFLA